MPLNLKISHSRIIEKKFKSNWNPIETAPLCKQFYPSSSFLFYYLFSPYIIVWGITYHSNIQPLIILQKKAVRIITFSDSTAHTSPLFKCLNLLKVSILLSFILQFMHQYKKGTLPDTLTNFLTPISSKHHYRTRLASKSTLSLQIIRTNYGKFNIRFYGPMVWNSID